MPRAAFHNLGCKVNEYESEAMKQELLKAGYEIVPFEGTADVYVVNTCTVTQVADRKSRQMLHKARQKNPDAVVVAAGCYVQEAKDRLLNEEAVDIVIGNNEKNRLADILREYVAKPEMCREFVPDINKEKDYEALFLERPVDRTRAFIKIQDGCNQFCTYCLIPYVRGRVRSREKADILKEARRMAENDVREIVLTGIHISSYGLDFLSQGAAKARTPEASDGITNTALIELIEALNEIPGIQRIRLGSLEPGTVTDEFAARLSACGRICPQFHLSMQSGCDATLKRMNRRYTAADFRESVRRLRKVFDRPAITTDIIVGFPGETEEEFEGSLAFTEEMRFAKTHIFKYSRRKRTVAYDLPDQVTETVKTERSKSFLDLDKAMQKAYLDSLRDRTLEVLFEEKEERSGMTFWKGHSRENALVLLASEDDLTNRIVPCRSLTLSPDGALLAVRA